MVFTIDVISKEQIENTPLPPEVESGCGVSPVVAWAGNLLGKQWTVDEIDAVCPCPAPGRGTRYAEMLGLVGWVLQQGHPVTEISPIHNAIPNLDRAEIRRLEEGQLGGQYAQLKQKVKSHPDYSHEPTQKYADTLRYYLKRHALLTVIREDGPRMVGVTGSFDGGITSMYNPIGPELTWPTVESLLGRIVKEAYRGGWPTFVLHSTIKKP